MKKSKKALWQKIMSINLEMVWNRLVVKNGYTSDRATQVINEYRKFLYASSTNTTDKRISPTPDVDEVWHAHIMHLPSYIRDCMNTFGRIIYHVPNQISEQEVRNALEKNNDTILTPKVPVGDNTVPGQELSADCRAGEGKCTLACSQTNFTENQIHFSIMVPENEYSENSQGSDLTSETVLADSK